jgi:hypothetical protein
LTQLCESGVVIVGDTEAMFADLDESLALF